MPHGSLSVATTITTMPTLTLASAARPDDHVLVLFGATGDLARRKLLPGLFRLAAANMLPERYRIIGSSPSELSDVEFRQHAHAAAPTPTSTTDSSTR